MREEQLTQLIELLSQMEKLAIKLPDMRYALETANTIWQKSPFAVGDRVKLARTPEITETHSWGWLGAKHFLVEGAQATIQTREFFNGQFYFGLHFDDESWISHLDGTKRVPDRKAIFSFGEDWLEHA